MSPLHNTRDFASVCGPSFCLLNDSVQSATSRNRQRSNASKIVGTRVLLAFKDPHLHAIYRKHTNTNSRFRGLLIHQQNLNFEIFQCFPANLITGRSVHFLLLSDSRFPEKVRVSSFLFFFTFIPGSSGQTRREKPEKRERSGEIALDKNASEVKGERCVLAHDLVARTSLSPHP